MDEDIKELENLNNVDDDILKFYFNRVLSYPKNTSEDFQYVLYKKKELYKFRIHHLPEFNDIQKIKEYIKLKCLNRTIKMSEHQNLLRNYLTPDSPYSGLLLFHGLGLGKTCAAINIAEGFKDQIEKYQTKIHIIVPGPTLKAEWKDQIVKCTGETYKTNKNINKLIKSNEDETKINSYYKIMSVKSFLKHTIGEKIKNPDAKDKKNKYKKNDAGEYERTEHVNKITNLSNTLLIIDEAHGLTDNEYSKAVQYIVKNSYNLKVLLLTGTPMKNSATDIIDLLNLIKPEKEKIKRSDIFELPENISNLKFTKNGKENLIKACRGYVSYMNNNDYLLFASKLDKGIITENLKFTPIIPCLMSEFQLSIYQEINKDDKKLNKSSSDATNFAFPIIENNKIIPKTGYKGKLRLINDLFRDQKGYNELLSKFLNLKTPNYNLLVPDFENKKYFFGEILTSKYLNNFSSKYYHCLKHIEGLINDNVRPIFIYSNAVEIGINLFSHILLQNGFLEFKDDEDTTNTKINNDTVCYKCGEKYKNHKNKDHQFRPAVFFSIVGKQNTFDNTDEEQDKKIIKNYFNHPDNYDGKIIKIVLGSKVISEGYNIFNLREVHILDTYYNIARVEQVIGRAIRRCSHAQSEEQINKNPFPTVEVYRYCTTTDEIGKEGRVPTVDETLYVKAEKKHILIKQVERLLKENAVDCPLFYNNNKYGSRFDKYKDCIPLKTAEEYDEQVIKDKTKICPVACDYMKCDYKCNCDKLNEKYYDDEKKEYKDVKKEDLDVSTVNDDLFSQEILDYKEIIKYMFIKKFVYVLDDFINEVKQRTKKSFDIYTLYKALDDFIINSDNEIINLTEDNYIYDKFNRPGYLQYINKFYIFQPLWEPTNQTIFERENYHYNLNIQTSLNDFLVSNNLLNKQKKNKNNEDYDFESGKDYYLNREEFDIVGIIDKEPNKKKTKSVVQDIFKLRKKIKQNEGKNKDKRRLTGLQTYNGSVCFNSYTYEQLIKFCKLLNINLDKNKFVSRTNLCSLLENAMIEKEKYSTDKKTYVIIPSNHPIYQFPLNIHDRVKYIKRRLTHKFMDELTLIINKKEVKNGVPQSYEMIIKKSKDLENFNEVKKYLKSRNYKFEEIGDKDNFIKIIVD